MIVLLATFETGIGGSKEKVLSALKESGKWARLTDGTYLISTWETAEQVRNRISPHLGLMGKAWVGLAPAPSAWFGLPEDVSAWIHKNQR